MEKMDCKKLDHLKSVVDPAVQQLKAEGWDLALMLLANDHGHAIVGEGRTTIQNTASLLSTLVLGFVLKIREAMGEKASLDLLDMMRREVSDRLDELQRPAPNDEDEELRRMPVASNTIN